MPKRKSKLSVTKYGGKGKNENATTLKTDSIKHAELPACMLMLEGENLTLTYVGQAEFLAGNFIRSL